MQFEIKETADPGVFEVQAKLLGMEVKKIDLVFQVKFWASVVGNFWCSRHINSMKSIGKAAMFFVHSVIKKSLGYWQVAVKNEL